MASKTTPAPWDHAAPEDQLFVLITGANRFVSALVIRKGI